MQSLQGGDAFGLSTRFVGLDNFATLFADPDYLGSLAVTAFFSVAVALLALVPGLLLAVMADRVVQRRRLLQDRAAAALRDRAGDRRGVVDVPVQPQHRRRRGMAALGSGSTGTISSMAGRRCCW